MQHKADKEAMANLAEVLICIYSVTQLYVCDSCR